jgi:hypothetical protein
MQLDHGTPEFLESFSNIGEKTWESLNIPRHSRVLQFHARCSSVQLQGAQGQEQEGPDGMKGMEGAPKLIKDDYTLFFWVWNLSSSKGFLVGKCQAHPAGPCQCMLLDTGMSENGVYTKKPQFINYLYWFVVIWSTNSSIFVYFYGIPPFVTPILMLLSAFQIDPNKFASVSVVQRREDGHSVIPTHLEESRTS